MLKLIIILLFFTFSAGAQTFRRTIDRVTSLDPIEASSVHASRAVSLIYESLLEYSYDARPYALKPLLATTMPSISDDGITYTFTINTNAFFMADKAFGRNSDGSFRKRNVTAEDVIYSFKRLADAKNASPGYWTIGSRIKGAEKFREISSQSEKTDYSLPVEGLVSDSPDKLVITLTAPSPVFLWLLAMPYTAVVPREVVEFYGSSFGENPVGTGPYYMAGWRRNYSMLYRRNPEWRGWRNNTNRFEELYFCLMDDPSTQWLAFLAGELDLQGEVSRDNWDEVVTAKGELNPDLIKRGFMMSKMATLEVSYIGINMDDPVLGKNKKLRQALNAAFDAVKWEEYYRGRAKAASGPVPPNVEGAVTNDLPYGRGVETAKKLLAEAGYENGIDKTTGKRLSLSIDIGRTTQDMRESTELLAAFMDRCGIELIPEYNNWPSFLKKVSSRRSQLFRISWVGDYPDAENFLQLFYSKNASPGPNRSNYNNPVFDNLYERALIAPKEERLKLYRELQEILQADSPWVFLSFQTALSLSAPTVENYIPHDFPYGMEKHYHYQKSYRNPDQKPDPDPDRK